MLANEQLFLKWAYKVAGQPQ